MRLPSLVYYVELFWCIKEEQRRINMNAINAMGCSHIPKTYSGK